MSVSEKNINRFNGLLLIIIFYLLDTIFKHIIVEKFEALGFSLAPINTYVNIFAYILIIIIILFASFTPITVFSRNILQLFCLFLLFPSIILFKNMQTDIQILIANTIMYFVLLITLKFSKIRIRSKCIKENQKISALFIIIMVMIIPYFYTFQNNINLDNFLLKNIYETRFKQRELENAYLAYSYSWLTKIIIPIALVYSMATASRMKSIILIFILSYLYLVGAHKTVFFGTIVIIIYYFIPPNYIQLSMNFGILLLLLSTILMYYLKDNIFFTNLFVRRIFFLPALLDTYYFDFFNEQKIYWSSSFLSGIIEYPYELDPPYLIGKIYFNNPEMSANNGIISNGYSNFGWIGIIINIVIVSLIFSFLNSLHINHVFFGIFIIFFISILSSALSTVLLTHGGIILILISQFILKDTDVNALFPNKILAHN